jgi:hypothetical protein
MPNMTAIKTAVPDTNSESSTISIISESSEAIN